MFSKQDVCDQDGLCMKPMSSHQNWETHTLAQMTALIFRLSKPFFHDKCDISGHKPAAQPAVRAAFVTQCGVLLETSNAGDTRQQVLPDTP